MVTIQNDYINALLADAAYVDNLDAGNTGTSLSTKLTTRMTEPQAQFIAANVSTLQISNRVLVLSFVPVENMVSDIGRSLGRSSLALFVCLKPSANVKRIAEWLRGHFHRA